MNAIVTTLSILSFFIGQWLVTRQHCGGFLVWAGSNLLIAVVRYASGDFATAFLFAFYFLANSYSLIVWFKRGEASDQAEAHRGRPSRGIRWRPLK